MQKNILLFLLVWPLSQAALAQFDDPVISKRWWLIGAGFGKTKLSSDVVGESYVDDGSYLDFRFGYAQSFNQKFIGEINGGWHSSSFDLNRAATKVSISNSALYFQLAPKYVHSDALLVGPLLDYFITDDYLASNATDGKTKILYGLEGAYQFPIFGGSYSSRVGLTLKKPFDIGERSALIYGLYLQVGLPFSKEQRQSDKEAERKPVEEAKEEKVEEFQEEKLEEKKEEEKVEKKEEAVIVQEVVVDDSVLKAPLTDGLLIFSPLSTELNLRSQEFLQKTAKFLTQNDKFWSKIRIQGFTDGVEDPNDVEKVSLKRAFAVGRLLKQYGIDAKKVVYVRFDQNTLAKKESNPEMRRVDFKVVETELSTPKFSEIIQKLAEHYSSKKY